VRPHGAATCWPVAPPRRRRRPARLSPRATRTPRRRRRSPGSRPRRTARVGPRVLRDDARGPRPAHAPSRRPPPARTGANLLIVADARRPRKAPDWAAGGTMDLVTAPNQPPPHRSPHVVAVS